MWIRRRRGWEIAEAAATPEDVFLDRRQLLRGVATGEDFPTQIYNGYGPLVADLYRGLENEKLFI